MNAGYWDDYKGILFKIDTIENQMIYYGMTEAVKLNKLLINNYGIKETYGIKDNVHLRPHKFQCFSSKDSITLYIYYIVALQNDYVTDTAELKYSIQVNNVNMDPKYYKNYLSGQVKQYYRGCLLNDVSYEQTKDILIFFKWLYEFFRIKNNIKIYRIS